MKIIELSNFVKIYQKYTKSTKMIPGISKLWLVQAEARNLEKVKCPQEEEERGTSWPSLLRGRQKNEIDDISETYSVAKANKYRELCKIITFGRTRTYKNRKGGQKILQKLYAAFTCNPTTKLCNVWLKTMSVT